MAKRAPMVSPGDGWGELCGSPLHEKKGNSFGVRTLSSVEAVSVETDLEGPGETPQRPGERAQERGRVVTANWDPQL